QPSPDCRAVAGFHRRSHRRRREIHISLPRYPSRAVTGAGNRVIFPGSIRPPQSTTNRRAQQPPTLNQALHLIGGDTIQKKVTNARSILAATRNIDEMYLRTLSRYPDDEERSMAERAIAKAGDPRLGYEDLLWALLNS